MHGFRVIRGGQVCSVCRLKNLTEASANQRSGRCGRVSNGIAIRLYSEDDYNKRPLFTEPEILRTNLAAVILQLATMWVADVEDFPFVEPPDIRLIRDGYKLLFELGAVDADYRVTPIGQHLALRSATFRAHVIGGEEWRVTRNAGDCVGFDLARPA